MEVYSCPACEGTGTEYGPGDVLPGWCSLCFGRGSVTLEVWNESRLAGEEDEGGLLVFVDPG